MNSNLRYVIYIILFLSTGCTREAADDPSQADPIPNSLHFSFRHANGERIKADQIVTRNSGDSVFVELPPGTYLKNLVPEITHTGKSIYPASGTNQNFSSPIVYTLTNKDGSTTKTVVKAAIMQPKSIVFVGIDDYKILAIDALNGSLRWAFEGGASFAYSSPTYKDGILYSGCTDNYVYAINPLNGEMIWKFFAGETGVESDAVCVDSTVYTGSNDDHLYAINSITGELRWKFLTNANVSSSPVISGDTVYFGSSDSQFYALRSTDGTLLWQFSTQGMINQSAATLYNNTLYFGSRDGHVYALDATTGKEKWKFSSDGISFEMSSPTIKNGVLYIGSWYDLSSPTTRAGSVYAIDVHSGKLIWESLKNIGFSSSPYITDKLLYICRDDLNLSALDPVTGNLVWSQKIFPNSSSPVEAHGIVYCGGSGTRYFYALDAMSGLVRWTFPLGSNASASSPLIIDELHFTYYPTESGMQN